MHKRICSCILLAVLVFSLSGCGPTILQGEDEGTLGTRQETEENKAENQTTEDITTETNGLSAEDLLAELNHYCEQMDAEQLPEENRWISAYAELVLYLTETYMEECEAADIDFLSNYGSYTFNLIYLNEDDTPELVAGPHGLVSLYAYEAGEEEKSISGTLHTIMDRWGYGAGGNYGYDYLPKENVIYNVNSDYAGAVQYLYYLSMNEQYELKGFTLSRAYLDEDGNVFMGSVDKDYEPQTHYYYYCDDLEQEISEVEFLSDQVEGDYESVVGRKSSLEIMEELYQYYLTCCK